MFIQKITITFGIENISDCKIYLEDDISQDTISLNLNTNNTVVVYRTFDVCNNNVIRLYWINRYSNPRCMKCSNKCRCNYENTWFSIGKNYKAEIQINVEEEIVLIDGEPS
jgi:hypothetical protein